MSTAASANSVALDEVPNVQLVTGMWPLFASLAELVRNIRSKHRDEPRLEKQTIKVRILEFRPGQMRNACK